MGTAILFLFCALARDASLRTGCCACAQHDIQEEDRDLRIATAAFWQRLYGNAFACLLHPSLSCCAHAQHPERTWEDRSVPPRATLPCHAARMRSIQTKRAG